MKVAVSSVGPSLEDRVDERFGRASYLLIVDDDTPRLKWSTTARIATRCRESASERLR